MPNTTLVITGMGAVTPIGIGCDAYWQALLEGRCGVGPVTRFDPAGCPVRIAAEVHGLALSEEVCRTLGRNMDLFSQFAFAAAEEALQDADIKPGFNAERTGVVMGTALDGMALLADTQARLAQGEIHKASPRLVPMVLGNMAACLIAMRYGFHGASLTVNTACSSGGDAIMTAAMLLRSGELDCAVCAAGESAVNPVIMQSLAQAKALSRNNDDPAHACRPFDLARDGFVIGEGGGAIVLETEEHAQSRGARPYAVLAGCANTHDAYHITSPRPDGGGAAECMRLALARAGLIPSDIGYVNAHGTSTHAGDVAETAAIHSVFGDGAGAPPISSTKGATGHLMGAGGITEVIACIKAMQTGLLPPNINYDQPDPECRLNIVANEAREASLFCAMSNSLGFGGQNSSVVVARRPGCR
ncbi:MAG: beta-ketoacyl-[acyl-carrier-protein] synthase family protein [Desulfovibrio sp.]|nr:beta-ketoacyl-[acyl-carrier-protein] synthase family protein [Desulfovibrio sp.]MBR4746047.1 beta-ketoacyl-[acyl-carrier-protein] synthase family protein [Desulfovibrio sp.]